MKNKYKLSLLGALAFCAVVVVLNHVLKLEDEKRDLIIEA